MEQKIKVIISVFLCLGFVGSFVTGKMLTHDRSLKEAHEVASTITLILMLVHVVGYWSVIKCQFKK